ncbi:molybdopterin-dependent oxidoreductase [Streptomyces bauhiniae]|uniref:molybdopterin-dependent oxidoreductase n=1 Tax=Streptomyces bauhiniae TaxID=2340725 RepID=UPI00367EA948
MTVISRGFHGRRSGRGDRLPPGQYETFDFPVLSTGPTPHVSLEKWELELVTEDGRRRSWDWAGLMTLPSQDFTVDLHCVTKWSKFGTRWRGVPLDVLLEDVETAAEHARMYCWGGYTTNLPLEDLLDGRAWIAHTYDDEPLAPEHGGPARLLVPHLYLWKSAKWIRRITLTVEDDPGFWESVGYHNYGDPWREQRYRGD